MKRLIGAALAAIGTALGGTATGAAQAEDFTPAIVFDMGGKFDKSFNEAAWRRATAHDARRFLDKLQADMPFPIQAIQVDGGSGFKADFETECQRRRIDLFELPPRSPKLNGHVERNNGAWRYEFYATWDLPDDNLDHVNRWIDAFADESDTFRPHQALGGHTPAEYLARHTAEEPPPSHMS